MMNSHQLIKDMRMAACEKIDPSKLNDLDIINICEEIRNQAAQSDRILEISDFLISGVVAVYEQKTNLLSDEVTHLLDEINKARKGKAALDPTVPPKGKSKANGSGPELGAEENPDPNSNSLSGNGPRSLIDLFTETGSTQTTQHPIANQPVNHIPDSFRTGSDPELGAEENPDLNSSPLPGNGPRSPIDVENQEENHLHPKKK